MVVGERGLFVVLISIWLKIPGVVISEQAYKGFSCKYSCQSWASDGDSSSLRSERVIFVGLAIEILVWKISLDYLAPFSIDRLPFGPTIHSNLGFSWVNWYYAG